MNIFNLFQKPTSKQPSQPTSSSSNGMANFLAAGSVSIKDLVAPSYIEVDFNNLKKFKF